MVTNRFIRSLLPAILCLSATASFAQTPQLKPGEYLSEDYMKKVKATHSPDESVKGVQDPCMFIVSAEADSIELMEVWGFHEGGSTYRLLPSGTLEVKESAGGDVKDIAFTILSNTDFTFAVSGSKPQHFVHVGTAEKWVAKQTIVGNYKDEEGEPYKFGEDGIAHFPGETFEYSVQIDPIGPPDGDYIYGETDGKLWTWVFSIKGDKLKLFEATEDGEVDSEPLYVLQRVKQPKSTTPKVQDPIAADTDSNASTP